MIDIHSHILPDIDDGPASLSQSLKYVKSAYEEGITLMIATPHAMDGVNQCRPELVLYKCLLLTQELKKNNIPVTIRPGSEIRLSPDLISHYDMGRLMTLNNLNTHILLELPPMFITEGVIHIINQLADRGITVIIAHPERNASIIKKPDTLPELLSSGALMQITAMSLMGKFGKRIENISETMVKNKDVTFVSSDIHPGRKFMMRDAYRKTSELLGEQAAKTIFIVNPREITGVHTKLVHYAN